MAHSLRTLLNSQSFKFFQYYNAPSRFMCNTTRGTDLVKQSTVGVDFLLQNLKNATTTRNILEMVCQHNRIMNNKHVMQALRSLFILQKHGSSDYTTREILNHPDFAKLCRRLKFQAPAIELNEVIEALKVVSYVGAPSNSTIVQVLLQLIKHNVNDLNLQQIIFMDFLLLQFKKTPMISALLIALPMVFEIQLPLKMESDNINHLADYLYYVSKSRLGDASIQPIVRALMTPQNEFDAKTAKSVIWSICNMDYNELFRPLLKKALSALIVHLDELSYGDMETTLSKLISRYTRRSPYFYDPVFFDSCANRLIDNDLGFKYSIYLLRKFARVSHSNNYLLDYMTKKALEHPEYIIEGDVVDIYSIAIAISLTEYKPPHWEDLKSLITSKENLSDSNRAEIIWLKFGSALCLLDIFKTDVLSRCLNEHSLSDIFKRKFYSDFDNYLIIWQSIKKDRPDLTHLLLPRFTPEILVKKFISKSEFPLEAALQKALGGENYVRTDMYSKMGHHINHVIELRKGGFPVAISSDDVEFIEDLDIAPDHQILICQCLAPFEYTLNNKQMKLSAIMALRSLEALGYPVVAICQEVWESLADFEKIPYLMQAIKEKVDSNAITFQSVI